MGHVKNSDRRKRKYGDAQKNRTAKNRANRKARHESRLKSFAQRAESLYGAKVRAAGQICTVTDITTDTTPREFVLTLPDETVIKRIRKRIQPL